MRIRLTAASGLMCLLGSALSGAQPVSSANFGESAPDRLPEGVPAGLDWEPIAGSLREIETRYGRLSVVAGRQCPATLEPIRYVEIHLNRQSIGELGCTPDGDYYLVYFKNAFNLGGRDLVILGANAGGSGSPPQRLHLIVLEPEGTHRIEQDAAFRSIDGTQRVAGDGERLWIDLGYVAGQRKIATFDASTLVIEQLPVAATAVAADSCRDAYRALSICATRMRNRDLSGMAYAEFLNEPGNMSNAQRGPLRRLAEHPGFDQEGFMSRCAQAAESGGPGEFALFEDAVCMP